MPAAASRAGRLKGYYHTLHNKEYNCEGAKGGGGRTMTLWGGTFWGFWKR